MVAAIQSRITVERIRFLFNYYSDSGDFIRRVDNGRGKAGTIVQAMSLVVDGECHKTTRYIWLHYYGEWPTLNMTVDHKNQIKALNRITNLRLATYTQNQQNKAGYGTYAKGVTWRNRIENPYQAKIRFGGKRIHLGSFATEEEAAETYRQAALKYHGEFACLE